VKCWSVRKNCNTLGDSIPVTGFLEKGPCSSYPPFLGTPSVNIGTRQNGRQRGRNVVDVEYIKDQIVAAAKQQIAKREYAPDNLYGDGCAAEKKLFGC
jgi:hypothetical protein